MAGCGGFCDEVNIIGTNEALKRNYAVSTMNSGHWGESFLDGISSMVPNKGQKEGIIRLTREELSPSSAGISTVKKSENYSLIFIDNKSAWKN